MNSFKLSIPENYRGVVLTCLAFETPLLSWFKNTGTGQQEVISDFRSRGRTSSAELIFTNGFKGFDVGEYACSSSDSLSQITIFTIGLGDSGPSVPSCSLDSTTRLFQIRVLGTRCSRWDENLKQVIKSQFLRSIMAILLVLCVECSFNADNLRIIDGPVCSSQIEGAALFRGIIADSRIAFCDLMSWQQSGPIVVIDDSLHLVDQHCDLIVTSLTTPECLVQKSASESGMLITIVAGSASGLGLVLVGFILLVLIR